MILRARPVEHIVIGGVATTNADGSSDFIIDGQTYAGGASSGALSAGQNIPIAFLNGPGRREPYGLGSWTESVQSFPASYMAKVLPMVIASSPSDQSLISPEISSMSFTFNKNEMNAALITDSDKWPSSVLNPANYFFIYGEGRPNIDHVTWEAPVATVHFTGTMPGQTCSCQVFSTIKDTSGNSIPPIPLYYPIYNAFGPNTVENVGLTTLGYIDYLSGPQTPAISFLAVIGPGTPGSNLPLPAPPTIPPYPLGAATHGPTAGGCLSIAIGFSVRLDSTTAQNVSNYTLTPADQSIVSAVLTQSPDPTNNAGVSVLLTFGDHLTPSSTYQITYGSGILDTHGNNLVSIKLGAGAGAGQFDVITPAYTHSFNSGS